MKKFIFSVLLLVVVSGAVYNVNAADYSSAEYYGIDDFDEYNLSVGENWYWVTLGDKERDVYISAEIASPGDGIYAELYTADGQLVDYDYNVCEKYYFLQFKSDADATYYIKINNDYIEGNTVLLSSTAYVVDEGTHGLNNWFECATDITTNSFRTINDELTETEDASLDIDVYRYTVTKPSMLSVYIDTDDARIDIDIYIDGIMIASTDEFMEPLKLLESGDTYNFNVTSGACYIQVRDGVGEYEIQIRRYNYQATPLFYNIEPLLGTLLSEFDNFTPQIGITGSDGEVEAYYFYVKNGNYNEELIKKYPVISSKYFSYINFDTLAYDALTDEYIDDQDTIQFSVKNTSGTYSRYTTVLPLKYDNLSPTCENVKIDLNEDSIEINVSDVEDDHGLSLRPYRYRIYEQSQEAPDYSDWSTSSYYNYGIEQNLQFQSGEVYVIDVQIRDKVAEKYQNSQQDISNHILTVSHTITIE